MAPKKHDAKPGDLIEFSRGKSNGWAGSYQHWAVYIGYDEVVHITLTDHGSNADLSTHISRTKAIVARENIWDVAQKDDFRVNNLLDKKYKPLNVDDIVIKACKMVGQGWEYNVVAYNCEHFATDMRYGKAESRQVRNAIVKTVVGTAVAVVVIFAILWYAGPLWFARRAVITSVI